MSTSPELKPAKSARHATTFLLVSILVLAGVAPVLAQGGSWGVTPATVEITDAVRGESYVKTVTLQNQLGEATNVTITPGGVVGSWVSTDPASGFAMAAGSQRDIELTITVPGGASGGSHQGFVQFVTDPASPPSGSGSGVRYAVSAAITVTLKAAGGGGGGTDAGAADLKWSNVRADDVEAGSLPNVSVLLGNLGNLRGIGSARAEILGFSEDKVLESLESSLEVLPGATWTVTFPFTEPLPVGQYRARVTSLEPAGFSETVAFKVLELGVLGKDGFFRGLQLPTVVAPGDTVRFSGEMVNTGNVTISAARLVYEVWLTDRLIHAGSTDPLAVPVGRNVTLTGFFTPAEGGTYRIVAHTAYDGLLTESRESIFTVQEESKAVVFPWWAWLILVVPVLAAAVWFLVGSRWRKEESPPKEEPPPERSAAARIRRYRRP